MKPPHAAIKASNTWSSPAFLKKDNFLTGSLLGPVNDLFFDEDKEWSDDRPSKRTRFGRASGQWRFVNRTPSLEKEDAAELQQQNLDVTSKEESVPRQDNPDANAVVHEDEGMELLSIEVRDQVFDIPAILDDDQPEPAPVLSPKSNEPDVSTSTVEMVNRSSDVHQSPKNLAQEQSPGTDVHARGDDIRPELRISMFNVEIDKPGLHIDTGTLSPEIESSQNASVMEVPDAPRLQPLPSPGLPVVSPIASRRKGGYSYFEQTRDDNLLDGEKRSISDNHMPSEQANSDTEAVSRDGKSLEVMDENVPDLIAGAYAASTSKLSWTETGTNLLHSEIPAFTIMDNDRSFAPLPALEKSDESISDEHLEGGVHCVVASSSIDEDLLDGSSVEASAEAFDNSEIDESEQGSSLEEGDDTRPTELGSSDGTTIVSLDVASERFASQAAYETHSSVEEVVTPKTEIDDELLGLQATEGDHSLLIREESSQNDDEDGAVSEEDIARLSSPHIIDNTDIELQETDTTELRPSEILTTIEQGAQQQYLTNLPSPDANTDISTGSQELVEADDISSGEAEVDRVQFGKAQSKSQGFDSFDQFITKEVPNIQFLRNRLPTSVLPTPQPSRVFQDVESVETSSGNGLEPPESLKVSGMSSKTYLATPEASQRLIEDGSQDEIEEDIDTTMLAIPTPEPTQAVHASPITLETRESVPDILKHLDHDDNAYHSANASSDNVLGQTISENAIKGVPDQGALTQVEALEQDSPHSSITNIQREKERQVSPSKLVSESEIDSDDQNIGITPNSPTGFQTPLSYYVPLFAINQHYSHMVDVLAIVAASTKAARAKTGPRDMYQAIYLTDPSSTARDAANIITAQLFRPYRQALPMLHVGDPILLRDFKVQMQKRKMGLISTASSSWAVFRPGEDVQVRGPPIELGPEEKGFAKGLGEWWRSLDSEARDAIEGSVPQESNATKMSYRDRRCSSPGKHELRSGTVYMDGEDVEPDSIHELRDGTTYMDSQG